MRAKLFYILNRLKILLLKDKYIKTSIGKKLAEKEHQETVDILANLNDFFISLMLLLIFRLISVIL